MTNKPQDYHGHWTKVDPVSRFWQKLEKTDSCWLWTAGLFTDGYGLFWDGKKTVGAHRFSYELLVGVIPIGLVLDHLCRVRSCVNPAHLEPVTHRENILRGDGIAARRARQTHCVRGHELIGENIDRVSTRPSARHCRTCHLERLHRRTTTEEKS
jgi:hypothetical protein